MFDSLFSVGVKYELNCPAVSCDQVCKCVIARVATEDRLSILYWVPQICATTAELC